MPAEVLRPQASATRNGPRPWHFLLSGLIGVALAFWFSRTPLVTPREFTREFVAELRKANSRLTITVVQDLELTVTDGGERDQTAFLHNAYDLYRQQPADKAAVIQKYVAISVATPLASQGPVDRTRIVPVVRDRPWLDDMRRVAAGRGAKDPAVELYDDLNSDLVVLYAEDSPTTIRYLTSTDLESAKIQRSELRSLALENLRRLLPKIVRNGEAQVFMLTAGGDYEASLLLLDEVWPDVAKDVKGDVVVAIPSRDVLLATGSEDPVGLEAVRQSVKKVTATGSYRLTPKLFVRRNGKLEEFQAAATR